MIPPTNNSDAQNFDAPPPSYDVATESSGAGGSAGVPSTGPSSPQMPASGKLNSTGLSKSDAQPLKPAPIVTRPPPAVTTQPVYYYRNPNTQVTIASYYPPDHPRSQCLMHGHVPSSQFGLLGILAAIFFFPIGVVACMIDRRSTCARCGELLEQGISV